MHLVQRKFRLCADFNDGKSEGLEPDYLRTCYNKSKLKIIIA